LVGEPARERPLGQTLLKSIVKEMAWKCRLDSSGSSCDRNDGLPGHCVELSSVISLATVSFSNRILLDVVSVITPKLKNYPLLVVL
jgi:hypothetical protein